MFFCFLFFFTDSCTYHPGVPVFHDALKVQMAENAPSAHVLLSCPRKVKVTACAISSRDGPAAKEEQPTSQTSSALL